MSSTLSGCAGRMGKPSPKQHPTTMNSFTHCLLRISYRGAIVALLLFASALAVSAIPHTYTIANAFGIGRTSSLGAAGVITPLHYGDTFVLDDNQSTGWMHVGDVWAQWDAHTNETVEIELGFQEVDRLQVRVLARAYRSDDAPHRFTLVPVSAVVFVFGFGPNATLPYMLPSGQVRPLRFADQRVTMEFRAEPQSFAVGESGLALGRENGTEVWARFTQVPVPDLPATAPLFGASLLVLLCSRRFFPGKDRSTLHRP